jgi:hypothetical protein
MKPWERKYPERKPWEQDFGPPEEPEEPEGMTGIDRLRGVAQAYNRGSLLGFGDEVVGFWRTVADYALPETEADRIAREVSVGKDQSAMDRYRMYRDDEREHMAEYEDKHGKEAMALSLFGGVASPVNLIAPTKGITLGSALARGATEGAVAGLGESEAETAGGLLKDAAIGGGTGMAATTALRGLGAVGRVVSGRGSGWRGSRAIHEMGSGEDFMPLHLADEKGNAGAIYRNTFGRSWGGKRTLAQQEAPFVDASKSSMLASERYLDDVKAGTKHAKVRVAEGLKRAKEDAADTLERETRDLTAARSQLDAETVVGLADDERNFRHLAGQESVPDDFRVDVLSDDEGNMLDMDNVHAVAGALRKFWNKSAFKMVKERQFEWDNDLIPDVKRMFADDPNLALTIEDAPGLVESLASRLGLKEAGRLDAVMRMMRGEGDNASALADVLYNPSVKIDGDALMELRNVFAKMASSNSDNARGMRRIKDRFDEMIRAQLPDDALVQFNEQLNRYATYLGYQKSAVAARKKAGRFSAEDWLTQIKSLGRTGEGAGPLQAQADDVVARASSTARSSVEDKAARDLDKLAAADRKKQATRAAATKAAELRENIERSDAIPDAQAAKDRAVEKFRDLARLTTPEQATGLSELLTTRALGSAVPTPASLRNGIATSVLTGSGVGRLGVTQPVQRFVGGQTKAQLGGRQAADAIRRQLQKRDVEYWMSRGLSRQAAIAAAGE